MSTLGNYSLQLALLFACAGAGIGVFAGWARRDDWTQVAERCVGVVFAFTTIAMLVLFYALGQPPECAICSYPTYPDPNYRCIWTVLNKSGSMEWRRSSMVWAFLLRPQVTTVKFPSA